jgi:subtilisin family serine protease
MSNGTDLWHHNHIGLTAARAQGRCGEGEGVVIGLVDTGIDGTHPDLQGRILAAYRVDASGNPVPLSDTSIDFDYQGHGTKMAGIICGPGYGIAPKAQLVAVVITDPARQKGGRYSSLLLALEAVAQLEDIQIVNLSASVPGFFSNYRRLIRTLIDEGEVLPVVSVGNAESENDRPHCPGNFDEVLSVGAIDENRRVLAGSLHGQMDIPPSPYSVPHLVAPGRNVYTCARGGGPAFSNGTSPAAAIVSGVAALFLEGHGPMTVEQLRTRILSACQRLHTEPPEHQGAGLVQV